MSFPRRRESRDLVRLIDSNVYPFSFKREGGGYEFEDDAFGEELTLR
jgi:hypothetical protein